MSTESLSTTTSLPPATSPPLQPIAGDSSSALGERSVSATAPASASITAQSASRLFPGSLQNLPPLPDDSGDEKENLLSDVESDVEFRDPRKRKTEIISQSEIEDSDTEAAGRGVSLAPTGPSSAIFDLTGQMQQLHLDEIRDLTAESDRLTLAGPQIGDAGEKRLRDLTQLRERLRMAIGVDTNQPKPPR